MAGMSYDDNLPNPQLVFRGYMWMPANGAGIRIAPVDVNGRVRCVSTVTDTQSLALN